MDNILKEIKTERARQDGLYPPTDHPPIVWLSILGEEFGEVSTAVLGNYFDMNDTANLREELVQVAAVAVAFIESLDRVQVPSQT